MGAFYVDWDEVSLASLRLHASELTHLFPGWLHLNDTGDGLQITDHDPSDDEARALARQHHLAIFPLVNNFSANINDFEESRLHKLSGFLKAVPADKTVLAIGNYAYDWVVGKAGAKTLVPTLAPAADLGVLFAALSGNLYLLFAVLVRTLGAALSGVRAGWGKLERRGSAQTKLSKK